MQYNLQTILINFVSVVKFKREYNSENLDQDLMGSSLSGKYFNQGVSSLVTLKNILALLPKTSELEIPAWSGTETYSYGECVTYDSDYYVSVYDGDNLNHAVSESTYWRSTTLSSILVRNKVYSSIETVMSRTIQSNYLIEGEKIYQICDESQLIDNNSKKVGFEIRLKGSDHIKQIINKISTQFTGSESFNLYLYDQNTLAATIAVTAGKEISWTDVNEELDGNRWFLFYDQDDITNQAMNSYFVYDSIYCQIIPFEIENTETDYMSINNYTSKSYGLGIDFSILPDQTTFILNNKLSFDEVLQLQFNYDMLDLFRMNPDNIFGSRERHMRSQELLDYINYELKGDGRHSLVSKIERAYSKLIKSFDNGDPVFREENNLLTFNSYG